MENLLVVALSVAGFVAGVRLAGSRQERIAARFFWAMNARCSIADPTAPTAAEITAGVDLGR